MKIDIVKGMSAEDYHSVRAASSSRLKEIMRSPAHLKHMDEKGKTSAAFAVGEAFHTAVLEPERFYSEFVQAPDIDKRTKEGKAAWQQFVDATPGMTVLSYDDMLTVTGMARGIARSSTASDLINSRIETELSLFWTQFGIKCKARIDAYSLENRCLIDLKSTQDASSDQFSRSISNFGYHIQAAWYIDVARAAGMQVDTMVFIAVEKTAPYGVGCYILDDEAIEVGRIKLVGALALLGACEETNNWPSYETAIQTLSLPRWAIREEVTL